MAMVVVCCHEKETGVAGCNIYIIITIVLFILCLKASNNPHARTYGI